MCLTRNQVCGQPYRGFESLPFRQHQVQELPLKLLKSRAKRGIYSFAALFDSVKVFCCSPGSGSICWYIVGTFWNYFFLYQHFHFPGASAFLFRSFLFFRRLIILVDAHLVLILPFHSSAGLASLQGHPKFPQGFVFLRSLNDLYFRRKYHE